MKSRVRARAVPAFDDVRVILDKGPVGHLVRCVAPVSAGEVVSGLDGRIERRANRYTIQIDEHAHVYSATALWRFMNHACDPTCLIDIEGRRVIARRDIAPGEEITFNYLTTEWDMAEPFDCRCGSPSCYGTIRGFRYLTPAERQDLMGRLPVSPVVLARLALTA